MANSRIVTSGDGIKKQFAVNFTLGLLDREHVTVRVGDEVDGSNEPVYRSITWINDGLIEVGGDTPANGESVVIERTVPKTALWHNYSKGVSIDDEHLDESNLQLMMAIHELLDGRLAALTTELDMGGFKIINLAEGEDDTDAATMSQLNATVASVEADLAAAEAAKDAAETAQAAAEASETASASSETNAAASEIAASSSATSAASSAASAAASASAASTSETNAATSETNAATSETNAASSASAAATSATNAAASESTVAADAATASAAATAAATSETNAATSETNAATSETNAAASESSAAASAAAAIAVLESAPLRDITSISVSDSPFTLTDTHNGHFIAVDTSGGAVTINVDPNLSEPFNFRVKKETGDTNAVNLVLGGTEEFSDGDTSKAISSVGGMDLILEEGTSPDTWKFTQFGASAGDARVDTFTDGVDFTAGSSTTVTLTSSAGSENNVVITFDGVTQHHSQYSVSGTTVTFSSTIPSGVLEIEARYGVALSIGEPADGSVTYAKLASALVADDTDITAGEAEKMPTAEAVKAYVDNTAIITKQFTSASTSYTNGGFITLAHGLGETPKFVQIVCVCKVANLGYSVGDEVVPNNGASTTGSLSSSGFSYYWDSTNVYIQIGLNGLSLHQKSATAGAYASASSTNWNVKARAFA